jgi:hypothetical protein
MRVDGEESRAEQRERERERERDVVSRVATAKLGREGELVRGRIENRAA